MVAIDIVLVEMFLFYDVSSCDHVLEGLCNFVGGKFS